MNRTEQQQTVTVQKATQEKELCILGAATELTLGGRNSNTERIDYYYAPRG